MKTSHPYIRFVVLFLLVLSLALAACGGKDSTPVPETASEPTSAPTVPPATNTPAPTSTPVPTDTPVPTNTPEPTATPDVTAGFADFESPDAGVALKYPGDWFTDDSFGLLLFASNQALLDAPDPGEEGGVVLVIANDTTEMETTDPAEAINLAVSQLGLGQDTEIVSGPDAVTVNGLDGATAVIHATTDKGTPISALVGILIGSERSAMFFGVTPQETEADFTPIFEAMLNTLELSTPVVTVPSNNLPAPDGILLYDLLTDGEVVSADAPAVWAFSGTAGDDLNLTVTPLSSDLDVVVDVVDANGQSIIGGEVDNSFDAETISDITLPTTDLYYVTVRGFAGGLGNFQLLLQTGAGTANGDYPTSGAIQMGNTALSTVPTSGSATWTFNASAGDVVDITVTPLGDLDAVVDVLDNKGNSILPSGEVDDSFGAEQLLGVSIPANGVYTVNIRGFADAGGSFSLTLSSGTGAIPPSGNELSYGQTGTDTLVDAGTATWSFYATAGDFVDVTVTPLDENFDVVVDVLDGNGFSILDNGEQDESFDVEYVRLVYIDADGYYTIAVRGYDGATGNYEVAVDESLFGRPGTVVFVGDTLEDGDAHAFPFTAVAGELVRFYVWPEFGNDVVVSLYNDDTNELIDQVDNTTGFEEMTYEVSELANYYFEVTGFEGSTGSYTAAVLATDITYVEVTGGDEVYGRFGSDGLLEYFVSGNTGDVLNVTVTPDSNIDAVLKITDLDGNSLAEVDDGFSGEDEVLTYTFTEDGVVIIRVEDFFGDPGEFYMTLSFE